MMFECGSPEFYPEHVSDQARVYYGLVKTQ